MLRIYNTLTKKKELLNTNKSIKLYTCGITVHDFCHIGHAKIFVFFDTVIRYLNTLNIKIIYIRNITDIDDKIIDKSIKYSKSLNYITSKFIEKMHHDTKKLSIVEPSFEPKATVFINKMINVISILKDKFYAYKAKNNDIYYNTRKYKNYGQLSNRYIRNINTFKHKYKKYQEDFTLWKNIKQSENYFWKTKVGRGRPGWHTECAAMSLYYESKELDIHGGGEDLIFPHHENELAQCESIIDKRFVNIWMHVGHLTIENKKMSKTKKNYILIKDLLKDFNSEIVRFFFLLTHYRSKMKFSTENLIKAKKGLTKLYKFVYSCKIKNNILNKDLVNKFYFALNDDFNTPKAISILFNSINNNTKNKENLAYTVKYLGNIIGILNNESFKNLNKNICNKNDLEKINYLMKKRDLARKKKNWELADKIRDKLLTMNIKIEDQKVPFYKT